MSMVTDVVKSVVDGVLREILGKVTGTGKRARRRKGTATKALRTAGARKPAQPAKRQTSRRKTVRARSKVKRNA